MITERNSITRTTQIYPGKTLKGKTQQKLPQYRCPKREKGKTNKEIKNLILLLLQQLLSSTSVLFQVSVCVSNEEHYTSIYIHPFT